MNKLIFSAVAATLLAVSAPVVAQDGGAEAQAGSAWRNHPFPPGAAEYHGNSGFPPQPQQQAPYAYGNRIYPFGPYVTPADPYYSPRAGRRDRDDDGRRRSRDRDRDGDGVRNNRDRFPDDPNRR
jgi:hypothetical protein